MSFKQSDLDSINKAIASGALTVEFSDRKVTYRSFNEMLKTKQLIEKELGLNKNKIKKITPSYSKGF